MCENTLLFLNLLIFNYPCINSDCKELSFLHFPYLSHQISHWSSVFWVICKVQTRATSVPPTPVTSSRHVLARSTMFFCAILHRIRIFKRSCCTRNNGQQLQRWPPKGLHRILQHQQLSSLSSLGGIRQKSTK